MQVSGTVTATYGYDGEGKRVSSTEGVTTTVYIGNYFEMSVSEGVTNTVTYYYAGTERVAMRQNNGAIKWLLGDHLGSTSLVYDGNETIRQGYKAWGERRFILGGEKLPTTFRYTGQREEASIGLYYYGARWYDASLGRFVQPDSIIPKAGNSQDWDRYTYVRNNPLKYTDSSGHDPSWFSFLQGATYQFADDMTSGVVDAIAPAAGVCMACNQDDAFKKGQQAGRVASIIVSSTEQVVGAAATGAAVAAIGDTATGGALCAALSGGSCAPVAGVAVGVEVAVAVAGAVVYFRGRSVFFTQRIILFLLLRE